MNIFIIIPTIRTLDFLKFWAGQFHNCFLLIVEDHPEIQIKTPKHNCRGIYHYSWQNIREDFGGNEWIFSRKNAGIRSYGFWKAHKLGADIIITLDDDCYPVDKDYVETHCSNLSLKTPQKWINTYPHPKFVYTRGIPYTIRDKQPVVVSHGLWTNKIDLDGQTEIKNPGLNLPSYPPLQQFVPAGSYFPMCSMNLAFSRQATPLMYFPLMGYDPEGKPWGYDRFDDIWAGVFAKKIIDHLGMAVINGSPFVEHRKASDPRSNIEKEKAGLVANEWLWKHVDSIELSGKNTAFCYRELAKKIRFPKTKYFFALQKAMLIWANLFISYESISETDSGVK